MNLFILGLGFGVAALLFALGPLCIWKYFLLQGEFNKQQDELYAKKSQLTSLKAAIERAEKQHQGHVLQLRDDLPSELWDGVERTFDDTEWRLTRRLSELRPVFMALTDVATRHPTPEDTDTSHSIWLKSFREHPRRFDDDDGTLWANVLRLHLDRIEKVRVRQREDHEAARLLADAFEQTIFSLIEWIPELGDTGLNQMVAAQILISCMEAGWTFERTANAINPRYPEGSWDPSFDQVLTRAHQNGGFQYLYPDGSEMSTRLVPFTEPWGKAVNTWCNVKGLKNSMPGST